MKTSHFLFPSLLLFASTALAGVPADVELEPVFPQGTFEGALGMVNAADGSDRLFVIRQAGQVEIIDGGQVLSSPFLDISGQTVGSGERGLLGLAFHPDFPAVDRVYINYTASGVAGIPNGDTVVSEFTLSETDPNQVDPDSERVLLTIAQDFSNHNGGNLRFGPDGYLYIGMGDGGSGGDPCNRSQTLDPDNLETGGSCRDDATAALLGKMLRLDIDNTTPAGDNNLCGAEGDGSAEYAIPDTNPFAILPPDIFADRFEVDPSLRGSTEGGPCAETWTWGLRNPWRWSFDRDTGDLWIADVGQNTWEEVNLEPADSSGALNYGWNVCEGNFATGSTTQPCPLEDSVLPVLDYQTGANCSITGGYRYRGPVTSMQGLYVYGDYCSGRIWFAEDDGLGNWSESEFSVEGFDLRSFGEDEQGNLYVLRSGGIWRFESE